MISSDSKLKIMNNDKENDKQKIFKHNSSVIASHELQQIIKSEKVKNFWAR